MVATGVGAGAGCPGWVGTRRSEAAWARRGNTASSGSSRTAAAPRAWASATNAARCCTRTTASAFCASSARTIAPVIRAGSVPQLGAVADPTSTASPVTETSRPASGEAPACQQISSVRLSSGSPMSARNLSATGNGSRRTLQPARSSRPAMYCAAAYSDSVPPMRGPMPTESSRRWRSASAGRICLSTDWSPWRSDGARRAPGRCVSTAQAGWPAATTATLPAIPPRRLRRLSRALARGWGVDVGLMRAPCWGRSRDV